MARSRIGIWLVGANGNVATTVTAGLVALKKGLVGNAGLVSELDQFRQLGFPGWHDFVVGGHDIRSASLVDDTHRMFAESGATDPALLARCKPELTKIESNFRSGTLVNVGETIEELADSAARRRKETPRAAVRRLQSDLKAFVKRHRLEYLIMVNLASTEPAVDEAKVPKKWSKLDLLLDKPRKCPLPASSLYAIAALDLGYPYLNFTPSLGSAPEAICELASLRNSCHMGRDGKTGETLLKSTLAPMFARRNLDVMSWVGHNIFGNLDGKVLDDPANKDAKVTSKDQLLGRIFGYSPETLVSIEYIQSMGDWKTAWDHVHFRGFLGTPMTLQFTWQGCDSMLAAPLVIDLVRFAAVARQRGETGLLTFLASFFKSPLGTDEHDFSRQFGFLEAWCRDAQGSTASRGAR